MADVGAIPPVHEILRVEHLLDLSHGDGAILPLICQPGIHVGIGSSYQDQSERNGRKMQRRKYWRLVSVFIGWQILLLVLVGRVGFEPTTKGL